MRTRRCILRWRRSGCSSGICTAGRTALPGRRSPPPGRRRAVRAGLTRRAGSGGSSGGSPSRAQTGGEAKTFTKVFLLIVWEAVSLVTFFRISDCCPLQVLLCTVLVLMEAVEAEGNL